MLSVKVLPVVLTLSVVWCPSTAHAPSQAELEKEIEEKVNALRPAEPDHIVARKIMKHFLNHEAPEHQTREKRQSETTSQGTGSQLQSEGTARLKRQSQDINLRARSKRQSEDTIYNVVYLIDSSNSLGRRNFTIALNALKILTQKSRPGTLFAAITFSDNATISFGFTTQKKAIRKLGRIPFIAGTTNTQAALELARRQLFKNRKAGATPGAAGRVLIITDGLSNVYRNKTLFNAYRLKMSGTEIYVVAVGQYLYGLDELVGLASSTQQHLFRAQSMAGLVGAVRLIPDPDSYRDKKILHWQLQHFGNNTASKKYHFT